MSLIGATVITTGSEAVIDWADRRPLLIVSLIFYFISRLVILWDPNIYILLLTRLIDGFGIGLVVTVIPVYISEPAPLEIRGLLNMLSQFTGSTGMFLSYCMVFGMSLTLNPNWRVMLGELLISSFVYFLLIVCYLLESPRWLVSKGRMIEAKKVLQMLRGGKMLQKKNLTRTIFGCTGEMALLVEGLGVGGETSIEEYIIGPANEVTDDQDPTADKERITLYVSEACLSWVARPAKGQSAIGSALALVSRHGCNYSIENQSNIPLMDPMVTLFGSVNEKLPEMGSMQSTMFPNFGSMFRMSEHHPKTDHWNEESGQVEDEKYLSDGEGGDSDDDLQSPLLSHQATSLEGKDMVPPHGAHGSALNMRGEQ